MYIHRGNLYERILKSEHHALFKCCQASCLASLATVLATSVACSAVFLVKGSC